MTFDFGALPPEINSTRMYTGAGAGPMMAAAAAWNNLAAELNTTASASQSVISTLTDDEWRGPSAVAMATAATPYVGWMHTTAAAAQHAANQAMASAAAYEAAFTMTVPPPVVVANRVQLAALVATNILGQNTPAIAATEAHYGEMWAQDAVAMYGYAGSSASAGKLVPLSDPASTTNPGGLGGQAAAVAHGRPRHVGRTARAGVRPARRDAVAFSSAVRCGDTRFGLGRFLRQPSGGGHPERAHRYGGLERFQWDHDRGFVYAYRRCGPLSHGYCPPSAVSVSRAGQLIPR